MGRQATGHRAEPLCRLIRFQATDGVALSGLLYDVAPPLRRREQAGEPALHVLVWIHGTGGASVFDSSRTNLMARVFLDRGLAFFPFNNRGAHFVRRAGRRLGGSAYERIRDCVKDIDGALRELRRRGYRQFTLIGHSTGANKIAVYDHYKRRNAVRQYVLVGGSDDAGLLYKKLGPRRFHALLKKARSMPPNQLMSVAAGASPAAGRPRAAAPTLMSWRSFYDMANPNGYYNVFPFHQATRGRLPFRYLHAIRKPALLIYGERDEYGFDAELLAANVGPNTEIIVIGDADHGFHSREEELAERIADWIFHSLDRRLHI